MVGSMEILEGAAYISFIVGAAFAVWQLYEMRRDRATQLVLSMMDTMASPEIQEMSRKIWDCEFSNAEEAEAKCGAGPLNAIGGWHEGMGYLVRRRLVDPEAVFEVMQVGAVWDKLKPWLLKEREKSGPAMYEHFEYIARMEREYDAKKKRKGV